MWRVAVVGVIEVGLVVVVEGGGGGVARRLWSR